MVKKANKKEKAEEKPVEKPAEEKPEEKATKEKAEEKPKPEKPAKEKPPKVAERAPKEKAEEKPAREAPRKEEKIAEEVKPAEKAPKEEKAEEKPEPKPAEKKEKTEEEFRHRVRISRVVLDGNLDIVRALTRIKGIGHQISHSLIRELNIDPKKKLGSFTEKEIEEIEHAIQNISEHIPPWMTNRQRDPYSGKNLHLTGPDLEFSIREDINLQKKLKSYRGIRHSMGLPVRGQRTRTSFRKGVTVGVVRKKQLQKQKG